MKMGLSAFLSILFNFLYFMEGWWHIPRECRGLYPIWTFETARVFQLNSLNYPRIKHSCGLLKKNDGNLVVIVAGNDEHF